MTDDFRTRLTDELTEVSTRHTKLTDFINTGTGPFADLSAIHQALLIAQASAMQSYLMILDLRIRLLDNPDLSQ